MGTSGINKETKIKKKKYATKYKGGPKSKLHQLNKNN